MNYHTDIVNFYGGAYWGGALIREERLFQKSYLLLGRSLERGAYQRMGAH